MTAFESHAFESHAPLTAVVDLFAGPGGWDIALADLGITDVLGVEVDKPTCRTRWKAGLQTINADVATLHPLDLGHIDGLVGSPPCQLFSAAGSGHGRNAVDG